jgi:peptidase E
MRLRLSHVTEDCKYAILRCMTNTLKKAMESVSTLPKATQDKIGEELLLHVAKVRRLRASLDQGLRSLDHGEGHEVDIEDVIKRARARYGGA